MNAIKSGLPLPLPNNTKMIGKETLGDAELSSLSYDVTSNNIFITQIHAAGVMPAGLCRAPAGFYVAVEINGKTSKTSVKSTSVGEDIVEWHEEILLPIERSSVISFKIYAPFKPGAGRIKGALLRRFKTTVGDLLARKQELQPIKFLNQGQSSPRSSLKIVIGEPTCHVETSIATVDLPARDQMNRQLEQLTDIGDCAFLRYRRLHNSADLHKAITHFEHARDICPSDHPHRSGVLFNLATAKFICCQDSNKYHDFDITISLYHDALHFRTGSSADHSTTAVDLCFAILARLKEQGDKLGSTRTLRSPSTVVESYAYRAALLALQMAELSVPTKFESEVSQSRYANIDDEESAWWLWKILPYTSDQDPDKPAILADLGNILCRRFKATGNITDIHKSISMLENAVQLAPDGHSDKAAFLKDLGDSLLSRFEHLGHLQDLNKSISVNEKAVHMAPSTHPDKPAWLNAFGISISRRFERLGNRADISKSISMFEEAVRLTPNGHSDKSVWLNNLGTSLCRRFEQFGHDADINRSISTKEEALRLTTDADPDKPSRLKSLGDSLLSRFEHLGDLKDLHRAVSIIEEAVQRTLDGSPEKPGCLDSLGITLSVRFKHFGVLADINMSISTFEEAVHLTPNGHFHMAHRLSNLGISLSDRFEQLGHHTDIVQSIRMNEEAVHLTPNDHPDRPARLNSLGKSLQASFEFLGGLKDINKSILVLEEAVHLAPDDHPQKPMWLNNLGVSLSSRFAHLGDPADLSASISITEKAVNMTLDSHPDKLLWLSTLGSSLTRRFDYLGDIEDLNRSILIFHQVLHRAPSGHPDTASWLTNLGLSLSCRFQHRGDPADINKAISLIEKAVCLTPDGHLDKPARLTNLGIYLSQRFERLGDLMDINKSISMNEEAVHLTSNDHSDRPSRLNNLGTSLARRFDRLHDPADINRSILIFKEAIVLTPDGHADRPGWLNNLGISLYRRFQHLGELEDIRKSIMMLEEAVNLTHDGHPERPGRLASLGNSLSQRFQSLGDLADIHKSISVIEEAVHLCPTGHASLPMWLNDLGVALFHRFEQLGDLEDLQKSISVEEEAVLLTPDGHPQKPSWTCNLGSAFMECFQRSRERFHLTAAISNFSVASRASMGSTLRRFHAARGWIHSAHLEGNSRAVLDAYATAIDLLPQLAWLGFPIAERHRLLLQTANVARDAAATALKHAGRPGQAVEWLEQGRAVVWGQFLQLRTPVDELRIAHPALANQFEQISQQLERASARDDAPSPRLAVASAATRALEEHVQRHHELALRREKLLVDIRSLPGFDQFLLPNKIDRLSCLAHSGPVVYLNASVHGCDVLIVTAASGSVVPVSLSSIQYHEVVKIRGLLRLLLERDRLIISSDDISDLVSSEDSDPTSRQFYDTLLARGGRAVKTKPQRLGGYTPDDLFGIVLAFLWDNAVKPVLEALKLGFSTPPCDAEKMPHIYWCPTGPFAFLPIHAAGHYDTPEAGTKLLDFAVSSYLPTLSALAPSDQTSSNDSSSNIHLITVPQPTSDGLSGLSCVNEEIDHIKTVSTTSPYVTLQESDGTVEDVMERMKNADWVHFACHGVQDPHNPLDSGLCLADGRRLKLSDIIHLSRPPGGLAFLSACQTAQGDEKVSEESVHLAAGMLLAGYGGVIATMWAIRDPDAPKVTRDVYEYLFRDGKVPDCSEGAVALHRAVQHLHGSGASFSSWVPFVHFGR